MGILSYLKDSAKIMGKLIKEKEIFSSILSLINTKTSNEINAETIIKNLIAEQTSIISLISNDIEKIKKAIEKIELLLYAVITINLIMLTLFITLLLR